MDVACDVLTCYICIFNYMAGNQENQKKDKKAVVENMFDSIAWRYDFLNHFLSFSIDRRWRRKAIKMIGARYSKPRILDVATGTADLAITAMRLSPGKITGIDISANMLEIGREKIRKKGLSESIELVQADSENIPFKDNMFDVAMVAFGVRNFADPLKGLEEMFRVLRPGGMVLVLEFSKPSGFPFRHIYNFYFLRILPFFGKLFSKDHSAYKYLPESVMQFPENKIFLEIMEKAGYNDTGQVRLTGGIASIYTGIKKEMQ